MKHTAIFIASRIEGRNLRPLILKFEIQNQLKLQNLSALQSPDLSLRARRICDKRAKTAQPHPSTTHCRR